MRRTALFIKRNLTEILRDPLSYIFCLALPAVMLAVFRMMPTGGLEIFASDKLTPSITVFSMSFTMLFTALLVSSDRASSFLTRLYTSPMKPSEFIVGYLVPGLILGLLQAVLCAVCGGIIAFADGVELCFPGVLLSFVTLLPVNAMYVFLGLIFGSLFSNRSAPGIASAIISCSGFLGGAWMPMPEGSVFTKVCEILPFYPAVKAQRAVFLGIAPTLDGFFLPWLTVWIYAAVFGAVAVLVFGKNMKG